MEAGKDLPAVSTYPATCFLTSHAGMACFWPTGQTSVGRYIREEQGVTPFLASSTACCLTLADISRLASEDT